MADLSQSEATQAISIYGLDSAGTETSPVRATTNQDLGAVDTVNTSALSIQIALTTTAVELKVGGSRLAERKYIWIEALSNNVKWGFDPAQCVFDVFKSQLFSFPIGDVAIYARMSSGTGDIAFGEGA